MLDIFPPFPPPLHNPLGDFDTSILPRTPKMSFCTPITPLERNLALQLLSTTATIQHNEFYYVPGMIKRCSKNFPLAQGCLSRVWTGQLLLRIIIECIVYEFWSQSKGYQALIDRQVKWDGICIFIGLN